MVKFHETTFTHSHPFETVSLAYFLRYPNPYSTHVISTDTIQSRFDPPSQTLYTARLHLKRSKIPSALFKLLPRSWLGANKEGTSQSYILERSIVNITEGVMLTESRNLDFTGVLKVVERQAYGRPSADISDIFNKGRMWLNGHGIDGFGLKVPQPSNPRWREGEDAESTDVLTKVELVSKLGDRPRRLFKSWGSSQKSEEKMEEEAAPSKMGFLRSWSTSSIQKSIEAIGLRRTERAVPNSKKGMNIVLERLRKGGLVGVLEGMRQDREMMYAGGDSSSNKYRAEGD